VKGEYSTPSDMACVTNESFHLPQADDIPSYKFGGWKKQAETQAIANPAINLVDPEGTETEVTVFAIWNPVP